MNDAFLKDKLIGIAEELLAPQIVIDIHFYDKMEAEEGVTNVWLLEMENGEEYWALEGVLPTGIFRKSGIYLQPRFALEAHKAMLEEQERSLREVEDVYDGIFF